MPSSVEITPPGSQYSPCGKYGCGDHGVCGTNNACTCQEGWNGVHCEIAPVSPPSEVIGESECGNWGVYGQLTLGAPGLPPTCDCTGTDMLGSRCERECDEDADCGTGTCGAFGRCNCAVSCFADADCALGTCDLSTTTCTGGWGDVRCRRALGNECEADSDCSGAGVCDPEEGTCVCDAGYTGLRCEFQLAGLGEACTYNTDCTGPPGGVHVCDTDGTCLYSGAECTSNDDCRVICRESECTYAGVSPEELSDQALDEMLSDMLNEFLTPLGLATFMAEEKLEEYSSRLAALLVGKKVQKTLRLTARTIYKRTRALYRRRLSSKVGMLGVQSQGYKTVGTTMRNTANFIRRNGIHTATKTASRVANKVFGSLMVAIQILGVVLDIMDTSGFNSQMSQDTIDTVLKAIMKNINEQPALVEAAVRYPMEYTPEDTIEWRRHLSGDVMDDRREELMLQYVNSLDVNSNGATIIREWVSPQEVAAAVIEEEKLKHKQGGVLWALAGQDEPVYNALKQWWWLILVLGVVVTVCIGLGIGLSARKNKTSV